MLKRWNKRWAITSAVLVAVLVCAGTAFALTSADFEPRAAEWQGSTCNEALLKAKASAATNQKIATCFAVAKVKEQQATIAGLQTSVSKLEASQTAPPLDFTFFNNVGINKAPVVSPVLDAGKYKTLTVTVQASNVGSVVLEASNNQETWISARSLNGNTQSEALSVTGRYYRITASPGSGTTTINAVAHLTA